MKELPPPQVVIYDDDLKLAQLTASLVVELGFVATAVTSPQELRALLAEGARLSLVLLDVNLRQEGEAEEVLRLLSAQPHRPRVVLSSGHALEDVPPRCFGFSIVGGFLPKPFTMEELTATLRSHLSQRSPPRDD